VLDHSLDESSGILTLEPKAPLTANDFEALAAEVDSYLANHDHLTGMLLIAAHIPGWENFAALVHHLRFVRDHQKHIARVAVLTDNSLLKIAPEIATHFAHPEFRVFAGGDRASAIQWLKGER
jgi:SpoIIAA-like